MALTKCPVEGCEHIGAIWQGWQDLKSDGVWVCADHYPLPTVALEDWFERNFEKVGNIIIPLESR